MKALTFAIILSGSILTFGGELADFHSKYAIKKNGDPKKSQSLDASASTNHGIIEIGIERTTCFGTCPAYTFIVRSDGTFRYKGEKHVERIGDFTGTIPVFEFHQLAQFIRDSGYLELDDTYERGRYDSPTVFTSVLTKGKRKVVSSNGDTGPSKLWAVEQLIDSAMRRAKWNDAQKVEPKGKKLSQADAIRIAAEAATKHGYRLSKFKPPRAEHEVTRKDATWSVFYEGKEPIPGNHFIVSVKDQSGEAQVMPGQ